MLAELNHVKKTYKDFQLDCSLAVREDCVTGLIGANGAGKSTHLRRFWDLSIRRAARSVYSVRKAPGLPQRIKRTSARCLGEAVFRIILPQDRYRRS